MPANRQGQTDPRGGGGSESRWLLGLRAHLPAAAVLAAMALVWTWPLALHFRDRIPGVGGDNFSFVWNLWWMRRALEAPDLEFFQSKYLFSPFGVDLINHPHTALQGYISATILGRFSIVEAENLYIVGSVFLNAWCAYVLTLDIARERRLALVAALVFGGSPYIAAHLLGHFDLLTAWVIPLFALRLRRTLATGSTAEAVAAGVAVAIAAYAVYYYVVYLGLFALTYTCASLDVVRWRRERRPHRQAFSTVRLLLVAAMALVLFLIVVIVVSGGVQIALAGLPISATRLENPLSILWVLALAWLLTKWRFPISVRRPDGDRFGRAVQALAVISATFAVLCLPLIVQAFRLSVSGRYVSQVYFWQSAPRGIDALSFVAGNPFHPIYGRAANAFYQAVGLDRIEAVAWLGVVPAIVLLMGRGRWLDGEEARRWKAVLAVFGIWALGPFLTVAGWGVGLPLPQALARFIPLVENARMPGRAMVCVYLALAVLMTLRLAVVKPRNLMLCGLSFLLVLDYLHVPLPLTTLDRPQVYQRLASIHDEGAVIEVPFGIGDGLSTGRGYQDRRLLYHATIHGHPVVGGYIGRMPPGVRQAYEAMPVVGNLLRLSSGEDAIEDPPIAALPFRYLVLDTTLASPELVDYVRSTLDMDLIMAADGKELFAVQGAMPASLRAGRSSVVSR